MKTLKFKTSINCGGCIKAVTPFLNEEKNIEEWDVDINNPDKILTVKGDDVTEEQVVKAVNKAGFKAENKG